MQWLTCGANNILSVTKLVYYVMDYVTSVRKLTERLKLKPETEIPKRKASTVSIHLKHITDYDDVFTSGPRNSITDDPDMLTIDRTLLRTHRKSREEQKRPLSVAKSMPLSPTIKSEEKFQQRLYNLHVNTDLLTSELMAMKKQDDDLARKLLSLYSDIRVLKVKRSCLRHSILLDEAIYEAELADEFPTVCDSVPKYMSKVLLSRGVTQMNISARRFSCS